MYFYTNKNEIRCSKNVKMENVSLLQKKKKKKRKQLFDTLNGKERDQPLFVFLHRGSGMEREMLKVMSRFSGE